MILERKQCSLYDVRRARITFFACVLVIVLVITKNVQECNKKSIRPTGAHFLGIHRLLLFLAPPLPSPYGEQYWATRQCDSIFFRWEGNIDSQKDA